MDPQNVFRTTYLVHFSYDRLQAYTRMWIFDSEPNIEFFAYYARMLLLTTQFYYGLNLQKLPGEKISNFILASEAVFLDYYLYPALI